MPYKTPTFRPPGADAANKARIAFYEARPERIEARRFYCSEHWRRFRAMIVRQRPVCEECGAEPSSHVHHVKPRRSHPELAFDESNMKAVCAGCHNRIEVRVGGG